MLNSIRLMPPITGAGIVVNTVPTLDTKPRPMANTAASLSIDGS